MSLHILFITAVLLNLKWNFTIVLICISLMTNNVEHLFFFFFVLIGHLSIFFGEVSIQNLCIFGLLVYY